MPPLNSMVGVGWLNNNALRNFPLADDASEYDITESYSLPKDLIVDFIFPVVATAEYQPDKFHVMEVAVFGGGVVIKLGYGGVASGSVYTTDPQLVAQISVAATHVPIGLRDLGGMRLGTMGQEKRTRVF